MTLRLSAISNSNCTKLPSLYTQSFCFRPLGGSGEERKRQFSLLCVVSAALTRTVFSVLKPNAF